MVILDHFSVIPRFSNTISRAPTGERGGLMHQSMLSPRGGGPGIPRGFVIYPFPVGGE